MPHITLPEGVPGILGPMKACPETERYLNAPASRSREAPRGVPGRSSLDQA